MAKIIHVKQNINQRSQWMFVLKIHIQKINSKAQSDQSIIERN